MEEIKVGQKEILFARHNGKLIYPKYASTENLVLHYDFSGRTNLDIQKGIAEDLSGNGNNGVLQNFAYIGESGYLDNALTFDGIDDFITIPEPLIDLDDFTYSEGINVLSFRGDNVATVVDGVVEIGGRNLIVNSDFREGNFRWADWYGAVYNGVNVILTSGALTYQSTSIGANIGVNEQTTASIRARGTGGVRARWGGAGTSSYQQVSENYDLYVFNIPRDGNANITFEADANSEVEIEWVKLEKGNQATPWTPSSEGLETTTFKPLFDNKIKSALYWNRALTDEELLQVYNTQIKRT